MGALFVQVKNIIHTGLISEPSQFLTQPMMIKGSSDKVAVCFVKVTTTMLTGLSYQRPDPNLRSIIFSLAKIGGGKQKESRWP